MDTRCIDYFLAVCRAGSVSAAAEPLFISRQSVARGVEALEKEAGVRLFQRVGNRMEPTREGVMFKEGIELMREQYDKLVCDMRASASGLEQTIRFGCNFTYLDRRTVSSVSLFEKKRSSVKVDFVHVPAAEQCWKMLESGLLDIAMTVNPNRDVGLPYYSDGCCQAFLCMSPSNPLSGRSSVVLPDALRNVVLGVGSQSEEDAVKRMLGPSVRVRLVPTMSAMKDAIKDNRLVYMAAKRQALDYECEGCVLVPIENCSPMTCFFICPDPTPIVEELARFLSGSDLRRDVGHSLSLS